MHTPGRYQRLREVFPSLRLRLRTFCLLCAIFFLLFAPSGHAFTLTILHTNDLHAHLSPSPHPDLGEEAGGVARLATLIQAARRENPHTLLLDAGDRFSGTSLSVLFQGEAESVFASLLGYDAVALGNHDFDFGQERLSTLRQRLVYPPMIAANIRRGQGGPLFTRPYLRKEVNGLRVLIVGLTTPETPFSTRPSNVAGLVFEPPGQSLKSIIEQERGTYDLLIVLSHLGYQEDRSLAEEAPGIDLIVGGHSHTKIETPVRVRSTLIVQAFQGGLYLGRVDLELSGNQIAHAQGELIPVSSRIPPDPLFASLLRCGYEERARPLMEEVVGHAPTPLLRQEGESLIGNLLADSFRAFTGADLAVFNRGGIRADIPAGPITVGKIMEVIPFSNQVMTTELTGRQVQVLFDLLASRGGGDAISGAQFRISRGTAEGILIGGQPIHAGRIYRVAANEFMMTGGAQFEILKQGENTRSYGLDRQALIEYLRKGLRQWPKLEGRIQR